MDLQDRVLEALKTSPLLPLYFSLYYAYSQLEGEKEYLDDQLQCISGDLTMSVITEEELDEDNYNPVEICCYLRGWCFDHFRAYEDLQRTS